MRKIFASIMACVVVLSASAAGIQEQINAKHKAGETFTAAFTEVKTMPKLNKETKREGSLTFKATEYLRMDYTEAGDYTLIDTGVFEVSKGGKVQKFPVKAEKNKMAWFRQMLLWAMQGKMDLIAKDVETEATYSETATEWQVEVVDKNAKAAQDVKKLIVTYAKKSGQITSLTIENPNGNTTTYKMK